MVEIIGAVVVVEVGALVIGVVLVAIEIIGVVVVVVLLVANFELVLSVVVIQTSGSQKHGSGGVKHGPIPQFTTQSTYCK